jgi:hypothetical protein
MRIYVYNKQRHFIGPTEKATYIYTKPVILVHRHSKFIHLILIIVIQVQQTRGRERTRKESRRIKESVSTVWRARRCYCSESTQKHGTSEIISKILTLSFHFPCSVCAHILSLSRDILGPNSYSCLWTTKNSVTTWKFLPQGFHIICIPV